MLLCFSFNPTAAPDIYTLSLHDALPICDRLVEEHVLSRRGRGERGFAVNPVRRGVDDGLDGAVVQNRLVRSCRATAVLRRDRKSTRLNSSHTVISYAVFCLKKKKNNMQR